MTLPTSTIHSASTLDNSATPCTIPTSFTPAPDCSTIWSPSTLTSSKVTYVGLYKFVPGNISEGIYFPQDQSSCFPPQPTGCSTFSYSASCPTGFQAVTSLSTSGSITAYCCPSGSWNFYSQKITSGYSTDGYFVPVTTTDGYFCNAHPWNSTVETTSTIKNNGTATQITASVIKELVRAFVVEYPASQITASSMSSNTLALATTSSSSSISTSATSSSTTSTTASSVVHSNGLSKGAKAGIGVGATIGGLVLLAILALFGRKMIKQKRTSEGLSELDGKEKKIVEVESKDVHELQDTAQPVEIGEGGSLLR